MKRLVVSQPMFLPWRGMFQQIGLCDVFVFYDDVQLPYGGGGKGRGFITRTEIKTKSGWQWLSVPINRAEKGPQLIREARFANLSWKGQHMERIRHAYRKASFFKEVYESVVVPIYGHETDRLCEWCIASMKFLCELLGIGPEFYVSSELPVPRQDGASQRLLEYCRHFGANEYLTGHGGYNYLKHDVFEDAGVAVKYVKYDLSPYPQLHGEYNPFLSIIDLLFNIGTDRTPSFLTAETVYWKEFLRGRTHWNK